MHDGRGKHAPAVPLWYDLGMLRRKKKKKPTLFVTDYATPENTPPVVWGDWVNRIIREMLIASTTDASPLVGVVCLREAEGSPLVGHGFLQIRNGDAHVSTVGTDPGWRSRGVGTLVMNKLEEYAQERECRKLVLQVEKWNTEAEKFYRRLGYLRVGETLVTWGEENGGVYTADCWILTKPVLPPLAV